MTNTPLSPTCSAKFSKSVSQVLSTAVGIVVMSYSARRVSTGSTAAALCAGK
jgi:hypothetical protein